MDAGHWLTLIIGALLATGASYFVIWKHARKIEALVPGGLKAWDQYDLTADTASPTGRTVTAEEVTK
jgi:hypothetical protein